MQANQRAIYKLLSMNEQQLVIPVYQRTYSWTNEQRRRLWDDIMSASEQDRDHFMGSVVRIDTISTSWNGEQYLIIDGQQRLTTLLILIAVLAQKSPSRSGQLTEDFLINRYQEGIHRYKMILSEQDQDIFEKLINGQVIIDAESPHMVIQAYSFFNEKVSHDEMVIAQIETGLRRLMVVDVELEKDRDDPQLIFESLNSTGLALTQSDLIRNFILLGMKESDQKQIYKNYWKPMEEGFDFQKTLFDRYLRDYLTICEDGNIPNLDQIYISFKRLINHLAHQKSVHELVQDLFEMHIYYIRMVNIEKEPNQKIAKYFKNLLELKVDVSYPFLLAVYRDYDKNIINEGEFLHILQLIESFVMRRGIIGLATNALNKIFANLHKNIDQKNYVESLYAEMQLMQASSRFPHDREVLQALETKDLFIWKRFKFLLQRLENAYRKERVSITDYTIEHIMPRTLSTTWEKDLGENAIEIHQRYINTLGNLTLTGYNSEMSNRSFAEKKSIKGGFNESPLWLNESVRSVEVWNEEAIQQRAQVLAQRICEIWPYPMVSEEILSKYRKDLKTDQKSYTLEEDWPLLLKDGLGKDFFHALRKHIKNLDPDLVREVILKKYIAYKIDDTNFLGMTPTAKQIKLVLNMPYDEVRDPKNICRDIRNVRSDMNGEIEIKITALDQINDVMELIEQSFSYRIDN